MQVDWKFAAGGSALVVALLAGMVALGHGGTDRTGTAEANPTAVVTLDPQVGETFTPSTSLPSDDTFMSANEAWKKWEDGDDLSSSISATFGFLNLLTGPVGAPGTETRESNLPVWAFQESYCMGKIGGPSITPTEPQSAPSSESSSPAETPSPAPCTTWTFLDAKTGVHVDTFSVPNS
jgi:hypothetical protein